MLQKNLMTIVLFLLAFVHASKGVEPKWTYANENNWGDEYPECNGKRQSPIALSTRTSAITPVLPLKFTNYNVSLFNNLTLVNNGHSADMRIPVTTNGNRPYITGGTLKNRYQAISLHFHWGSSGVKGSEHKINDNRYDVEMHIVHRNVKYATTEEATKQNDGLAVLGIMLDINDKTDRYYPGLEAIYDVLPQIVNYESTAPLNRELTLSHFLGDLNTNEFYTYSGSLTTPPCSEAVTWFVFPKPLNVRTSRVQQFFNLKKSNGDPLINNFRALQPRGNRTVLYRVGGFINAIFLPFPNNHLV